MLTRELIGRLPKAELHTHLDAALRPETMIELAGDARPGQRNVLDLRETPQQGGIADGDEARGKPLGSELQAKLRSDAGRLARGQRDNGAGDYRSSSLSST